MFFFLSLPLKRLLLLCGSTTARGGATARQGKRKQQKAILYFIMLYFIPKIAMQRYIFFLNTVYVNVKIKEKFLYLHFVECEYSIC